jgi:hypothetical protein
MYRLKRCGRGCGGPHPAGLLGIDLSCSPLRRPPAIMGKVASFLRPCPTEFPSLVPKRRRKRLQDITIWEPGSGETWPMPRRRQERLSVLGAPPPTKLRQSCPHRDSVIRSDQFNWRVITSTHRQSLWNPWSWRTVKLVRLQRPVCRTIGRKNPFFTSAQTCLPK